jgi:competence protein ComEC
MKLWKYLFAFLLLTLAALILALVQIPDANLHIIACNVGQGDAILMTYKNIQILTDGGPDAGVLTCLGKHLPFWDRDIELVISSHSDADHLTGLVDVIKNYKIQTILINPIDPGTPVYEALRNEVGSRGLEVITPQCGTRLRLGLIYLDILSPSEELFGRLVIKKEGDNLAKYSVSGEANLYSIAYGLSFGKFTGLFLGDIPPEISDRLSADRSGGGVDYVKIPHHGSKNGLTQVLLEKIVPERGLPRLDSQQKPSMNNSGKATVGIIGVISVGKNPWGLPNQEILDMLSGYGVKTLRTDKLGDVEVITDGEKFWEED